MSPSLHENFQDKITAAAEAFNKGNPRTVNVESLNKMIELLGGCVSPSVKPVAVNKLIHKAITDIREVLRPRKEDTPDGKTAYILDVTHLMLAVHSDLQHMYLDGQVLAMAMVPIVPEVPVAFDPTKRMTPMWCPTNDNYRSDHETLTFDTGIPRNTIVPTFRLLIINRAHIAVDDYNLAAGAEATECNVTELYYASAVDGVGQRMVNAHNEGLDLQRKLFSDNNLSGADFRTLFR